MKDLFETPKLEAATCSHAMEEALNLYMDGELPFAEQPVLFAHLATCDPCRRMLGAMMEFRRMSRQEVCPVPPAVDEAFFRRLDEINAFRALFRQNFKPRHSCRFHHPCTH